MHCRADAGSRTSAASRVSVSGSTDGKDAVAEVEDVAGPPAGTREDVERLGLDDLPRREQHGRVEVALHRPAGHPRPAGVERDPPVEADHVAAGRRHLLEQGRGARAEVDRRHVDRGEDARRVRCDVVAVVRGRERADPGVEQLDHVRARARLGGDVAGERLGQLLEQRVPDLGLRRA